MANKQVTLKRVIDTSGNTDTIHPTTHWDQIEGKPSTFTPTSHTHSEYAKRIDLSSQVQLTSYRKSVIALCNIDNSSISRNSWSGGTIFFHRTNGLQAPVSLHITMEKRYNAQGANYTAMALSGNSFGDNIQYVQFDYNGTPYGGIEFKFSDAEHGQVYFIGESNFDIFGLDYYRTDTNAALNTEVNNSISTSNMVAETDFFINNQKVFHAGNDGSGSGLDADTLDGIDSGSFLQKTGGTLTGTLTSRAIAMQNYNLTGVNMLQFNDPGPNEGIDWSGGNFKIYESPDDLTTNSAGNLQFVTGGTRRMTIGNDGYLYVSNTVQTPQLQMTSNQNKTKLRVWSGGTYGIGMHSNYTFGGLGTTGGEYAMTFQMNDDNDRGFWWGDSAHNEAQGAMALTTAGKLTVADKIRVGYGQLDTTDPSTYAVDASGDILISDSNPVLQLKDTDTSGSAYIDYQGGTSLKLHAGGDALTFVAGNAERARIASGGNFGIGTTSPASKLEVAGDIQLQRSNEIIFGETVGGNPRAVIFSTENEFSSDYNGLGFSIGNQGRTGPSMYIRSDGKVGIGTTTPAEKLTVSGKVRANDNFEQLGSGGYYLYTDAVGFRGAFYDNGSVTSIYGDGNGSTPVININSDKVGIGTTNPDEKLHIEGNILVDAYNNSPGDSGIFFREGFTASQPSGATQPYNASITLYDGSNAGASYDGLSINGNDGVAVRTNNDSTPKMVVKKSGDVGIGTETPSAKLHIIETTAGADIAKFRNNGDTGDVTIKTSGEVGIVKGGAGDQLQLSANGTDNNGIRITTAGDVGLGTTSPSYKLDVSGSMRAVTDSSTKIWSENTTSGQASLELKSTTTHMRLIGQLGGFQMYDQIDGASRFEIDTNGNSKIFGNLTIQSNFPRIYLSDTDDTPGYSLMNANGTFGIYDDTNAAYRMRINSSGNVGVGVDSPSYKLDVAGDVNITGDFRVNGSVISSGGNTWTLIKSGQTTVNSSASGTGATNISLGSNTIDDTSVVAFEINTAGNTLYTSQILICKVEDSNSTYAGLLYNALANSSQIRVGSIRVFRTFSGGPTSTSLSFSYVNYFNNGSTTETADTVYIGNIWKLGVTGA